MNDRHRRSHAAHPRQSSSTSRLELAAGPTPSQTLHAESPQVHALLEKLDDVIFNAVSGNTESLAEAQLLWPRVVAELGWQLVEESREQYLRYAIDISQRNAGFDTRTPQQALAALEIVSLLTKG
jgi:hypothetical protein